MAVHVAVSMLGGIGTEEARALRWSEVEIADAVGHSSTRTTEVVYRHQLRPVTPTAAIALGPPFESRGKTSGGQN
jgi:integrase